MSKPKLPGTDLLNNVKDKIAAKHAAEKKDGNMKNIDWKTVKTVTVTLISVAALVGAFLGGVAYQKGINEQVKSEVKALSAVSKE